MVSPIINSNNLSLSIYIYKYIYIIPSHNPLIEGIVLIPSFLYNKSPQIPSSWISSIYLEPSRTFQFSQPVPLTPCLSLTLPLFHPVLLSPNPSLTLSLSHPFPLSPRPSLTQSLSHPVTLSPCPSLTLPIPPSFVLSPYPLSFPFSLWPSLTFCSLTFSLSLTLSLSNSVSISLCLFFDQSICISIYQFIFPLVSNFQNLLKYCFIWSYPTSILLF